MGDAAYDVIVIGAGYGGAALAALQARAGRRVALIDKTPRAGGKAQTLERRGYRYEMFGAVGIPAHGSRFHGGVEGEALFEEGAHEREVPRGGALAYRGARAGARAIRSAGTSADAVSG